MNRFNKLILPLSLVTLFSATSCNQRTFNRLKYKECGLEQGIVALESIKQSQLEDDAYVLPNQGYTKMEYEITVSGYFRYSGYVNDINVVLKGPTEFSWDIQNKYLKLVAPHATYYVVSDDTGTYWETYDYFKGDEEIKEKSKVTEYTHFSNIVADKGDLNLSFGNSLLSFLDPEEIPFLQFGVTGFKNEHLNPDPYHILGDYSPYTPGGLFGEEYRGDLEKLYELYHEGANNHFFKRQYASDGEGTLSCNVKGNTDLADYYTLPKLGPKFTDTMGYANFDIFSAWKNCIMYQNDAVIDARVITKKENNVDLKIHADIRQDSKDTCTIDEVNLNDYLPLD